MKKLLLSLTAIIGTFTHAQTALHGTDWVLKKIVTNNITYNLPQNSEMGSPILTFTQSPSGPTTNMMNNICGSGMWAMIFNAEITNNSFNIWSMGSSNTNTCTLPENTAFFNQYHDYSTMSSGSYNYQITNSGGIRNLVITNSSGGQAFYQSGFLRTKETNLSLSEKTIHIYPNPVKESSVHLKNAERIEWIKVYNMEGKLILQHHSSDPEINVSNLLRGGYFVEVKSQSGISRHKLIKE